MIADTAPILQALILAAVGLGITAYAAVMALACDRIATLSASTTPKES